MGFFVFQADALSALFGIFNLFTLIGITDTTHFTLSFLFDPSLLHSFYLIAFIWLTEYILVFHFAIY